MIEDHAHPLFLQKFHTPHEMQSEVEHRVLSVHYVERAFSPFPLGNRVSLGGTVDIGLATPCRC